MAITRKLSNGLEVVDLTEEINEIDNQVGFVKSQNLFRTQGTSQNSIVFDKSINEITLLPQVHRGSRTKTYGKDRKVESFSLPLAYFKHGDAITADDIQGFRMPGQTDMTETLANVRLEKLTDMRLAADQTDEYLQIQALKGIFKTPEGAVVANMYTEFGVTQKTIDFDLGNANSPIDQKISELKRHINSNVKNGMAAGVPKVIVDYDFYDKLIKHPAVVNAYIQYVNSGAQQMRDDLASYESWGVTEAFTHRGVTFIAYNPVFTLPEDAGTEAAFGAGEGIAYASNVRDLFRGYYGPANKLSLANQVGTKMYTFEYTDPKDECHELELEMAPLYFCTRPASLVKVFTAS